MEAGEMALWVELLLFTDEELELDPRIYILRNSDSKERTGCAGRGLWSYHWRGRDRRTPRGLLARHPSPHFEFQAREKIYFSSKMDGPWRVILGTDLRLPHAHPPACAHTAELEWTYTHTHTHTHTQNWVCVLTFQVSINVPKLKDIFFSPSKHSGTARGKQEDSGIENKASKNNDQSRAVMVHTTPGHIPRGFPCIQ